VDDNKIKSKMNELMKPIDKQIMMTDDPGEVMMLACAMLSTVKQIFDLQLGVEGRNQMFRSIMDE
jgi:hypothetical protein